MENYKSIIEKVIKDYVKNPNYNQQNVNAKNFIIWMGFDLQNDYNELGVDEDSADHYVILNEMVLPTMTDGEIENTVESILEQGMDNIL